MTPAASDADFEFIRVKGGWAARRPGTTDRLAEGKTKRATAERLAEVLATRAWLREQEERERARDEVWLNERGLVPIDYRDLRPGDSYAAGPIRICPPVRLVTSVDHFDNGASLAFYDRTRVEVVAGDPGCTLLAPGSPVHGILRHDNTEQESGS